MKTTKTKKISSFAKFRLMSEIVIALVLLVSLGFMIRAEDQSQLARARTAAHQEDYPNVISHYHAVWLVPLTKDDLILLATSYRQLQLTSQADETEQRLVNTFGNDPTIALRQARLAQAEGRIDEADQLYREFITAHPDVAAGYTALARLHFTRGAKEEAYAVLNQTTASSQLNIQLRLELAILATEAGDSVRAEAAYQEVLKLDPANYTALTGSGSIVPEPFPTILINAAGGGQ